MRIAIFTDTYSPDINGVATHIKVLRDGLVELGHEVLIVTSSTKYHSHTMKNGILYCPAIKLKKLYGYGVASPLHHSRFLMVKRFNPDIIHTQQEFSMCLSAIRIAKLLHIPLVYTLHTMYDDYIYYIVPKPFVGVAKKVFYRYIGYIGRRSSAVTSPSAKAEPFLDKCHLKKDVSVIPNSIELSEFSPEATGKEQLDAIRQKYGIPLDSTVGIFCGRLAAEKSIDNLMDSLKTCIDFKGLNFRLLVIGDGPARGDLIAHAEKIGISDFVSFTGRIEHSEIMPVYEACDVYVSASTTEMMSISMLEGMAAGLPVIQKYDEANAHQIIEGVNGHNYKNNDQLGKFVKEICLMDADRKKEMKKKVRDSVSSNSPADLANYLLDIYTGSIETYKKKVKRKRRLKYKKS